MKGLWSHPQAGYILVALLTLAVYANSLDNPFLYDDQHSIVDLRSVDRNDHASLERDRHLLCGS